MLTDAWFPLRYVEEHNRLHRSSKRFKVAAAGRGSGKTEIARRHIVRMLPVRRPWSDPIYFYALPTYGQARRVAWDKLKALVPRHWLAKSPSETEMSITTIFGSKLYVVGMDKPQRIEGNQWDGGIIDESSDQRPKSFEKSVRPALSHKNGWCWRIGVPKLHGVGAADFKAAFDLGLSGDHEEWESFSWPSSKVLSEKELDDARRSTDPQTYREQYEASWESASGLIFSEFSERESVKPCKYQPGMPIVVGSDFNVNPMAWVLLHNYGGHLEAFDELFIRNTTTQQSLTTLHQRYPAHNGGWLFIGDATSRSRNTRATDSDYQQIRNDVRFPKKVVTYPTSNPAVQDRFASTNRMLRNAAGQRSLFIDPKCTHLIHDLKHRAYVEGTRIPDDHGDLGHITDALGYPIHMLFPIRHILTEMKLA